MSVLATLVGEQNLITRSQPSFNRGFVAFAPAPAVAAASPPAASPSPRLSSVAASLPLPSSFCRSERMHVRVTWTHKLSQPARVQNTKVVSSSITPAREREVVKQTGCTIYRFLRFVSRRLRWCLEARAATSHACPQLSTHTNEQHRLPLAWTPRQRTVQSTTQQQPQEPPCSYEPTK